MALTRKFLTAMGIEENKIEEIITAHTDVTSALKKERDDYKEKADQLEKVQADLEKANKKLKVFEESAGDDTWQKKFDDAVAEKKKVEKDFSDYKKSVADKELAAKKRSAYKQLLKDAGVSEKRLEAVLKVSDTSKLELDEDGKVKDSETLIKNVQEEWADFIVVKGEQGAQTANPPKNDGGSGAGARTPSLAAQRVAKFNADRYGTANKEG